MRELVGKLRARYRALQRTDVTVSDWTAFRDELTDALVHTRSSADHSATEMADAYWVETVIKELLVQVEQRITELEDHALIPRSD